MVGHAALVGRTRGPWDPRSDQDDDLLGEREVCRSPSLDVIREQLGTFFYPARIETSKRAILGSSVLNAVQLSHTTLGLVRFGCETSVDPGALGAYHVNVPITGQVDSRCGSQEVVATPTTGAVFTPREHTVLPGWGADAAQLCIKFSTQVMESELEGLLGHPVGREIRFDLAFDLTRSAAASWLGLLRLVVEEANRSSSLLGQHRYRERLERSLASGLLLAQSHNYHDELLRSDSPVRPRTVKRVVDLIEAHPEENYSLSELARHAGVSARRLQRAFDESLGVSPSAFLRRVRLERARHDLIHTEDAVMTVAYRWGFNHPGRFASAYRAQYGEYPSATRSIAAL